MEKDIITVHAITEDGRKSHIEVYVNTDFFAFMKTMEDPAVSERSCYTKIVFSGSLSIDVYETIEEIYDLMRAKKWILPHG